MSDTGGWLPYLLIGFAILVVVSLPVVILAGIFLMRLMKKGSKK